MSPSWARPLPFGTASGKKKVPVPEGGLNGGMIAGDGPDPGPSSSALENSQN